MPRLGPSRVIGLALLTLSACGGGDRPGVSNPAPQPVATQVVVSPAAATVAPGASLTLTAQPLSAAGAPVSTTVVWSSSVPSVASVDATGRVTGITSGQATITAAAGAASGSALITVAIPIATVAISGDTAALFPGGTRQLSATLRDASGAVLTGRTITWGTSAAAVATVNASGTITAVAPGQVTITAIADTASARLTLTVLRPVASITLEPDSLVLIPGETRAFSAVLRDSSGSMVTGRSVNFTGTLPSVATVSTTGVVTAVTPGRALVVASVEGRVDTAAVRVVIPEARLVFDRVPGQVRPGLGLGLVVRATRTGVDTMRSFSGTVRIRDEAGASILLGTDSVVARNGLAVFDELAIATAGSYRLRASAPALSSASSTPIVVSATSALPTISVGPVQRTVLTTGVQGSARYRIPVTLRDSAGPIAAATPVRVVVARGPGVILSGATTVNTTAGVATFELVIQGTASIDLEFSAPGFQSRVQAIDSPSPSQTFTALQRSAADSVVPVGGRITLSATLTHSALATEPVHTTTYDLSWNPAELTLSGDSTTANASYTINRSAVAEGVLRVTVAASSPLAALGASVLIHRFTLAVREGARGTQQVRLTSLTYLGASGESLATRRTSDVSFRVP